MSGARDFVLIGTYRRQGLFFEYKLTLSIKNIASLAQGEQERVHHDAELTELLMSCNQNLQSG